MLIHASCGVRDGVGVLIRGRPGSGKSTLLLQLIGRGFDLVADDCVWLEGGRASAPARVRGLIEVRGLGIYAHPYHEAARIGLVVEAGTPVERIAPRRVCADTNVPVITLDPKSPASVEAVCMAVSCLTGRGVREIAGPLSGAGCGCP